MSISSANGDYAQQSILSVSCSWLTHTKKTSTNCYFDILISTTGCRAASDATENTPPLPHTAANHEMSYHATALIAQDVFFFSLLHKCNMLCIRPQTTPTPTVMPGSGAVTFSHAALQHLLHNLCCDWQASINLGSLCSIIISPAIQLDSTQQHSWHCEASQKKLQVSRQGCC